MQWVHAGTTELLFAVSTQDIYTPGGTYIDEGLTIVEAGRLPCLYYMELFDQPQKPK